MSGIDIKIDASDLQRLRKLVGEQPYRKGVRSAINKLLDRSKTEVAHEVQLEYVAKVGAVKRAITVTRARDRDLRGVVLVTGAPISLSGFQTRKAVRGIRARVKRASAMKLITSAFQIPVRYAPPGTRIGILRREKGVKRFPIHLLFGPSIPSMVASEAVTRRIFDRWEREAPELMAREVTYFAEREIAR